MAKKGAFLPTDITEEPILLVVIGISQLLTWAVCLAFI